MSPILFIVFNRPDTTQIVFNEIKKQKPEKLYIAADGPRVTRYQDSELCSKVRSIVSQVDWPCDVKTLFREKNLGCKLAVSSAIDWFFENEERGIILEDDVIPQESFYKYCDELLERYKCQENIALISGCNHISNLYSPKESYFFSRYAHIWGWATWRRVWVNYDVTINDWPTSKKKKILKSVSGADGIFISFWTYLLDLIYKNKIDTWDYQLFYMIWKNNWLCITPTKSQTDNLGFGESATHTKGEIPKYVIDSKAQKMEFPLTHPAQVERSEIADKLTRKVAIGERKISILRSWLYLIYKRINEFNKK